MEDKQSILYVIVVIIIIALIGWWVFPAPSPSVPTDNSASAKVEEVPTATLAPALQLTEVEKSGNVSERKAEILTIVRSGRALTQAEREEIGGIMLTKANIYNFTEAERQDIFKALSRP